MYKDNNCIKLIEWISKHFETNCLLFCLLVIKLTFPLMKRFSPKFKNNNNKGKNIIIIEGETTLVRNNVRVEPTLLSLISEVILYTF